MSIISMFYSLRKRKAWENSKESPMCNHSYFAGIISRDEFRRRGIRPLINMSEGLPLVGAKCH